jgi:ubiquinone biosynthesis protein
MVCDELSKLRDNVPPFKYKHVARSIERAFGKPINQIFSHIEEKPVAAASIAQVHKAVLLNDDEVAVKVLRPRIDKQFNSDLSLFEFVVNILCIFIKNSKRLRLKEVVTTLKDIVKRELDLRYEAACADKLRENCKDDKGVRFPKIYWDITSEQVLTSEWIKGVSVNDKQALIKAGHNLKSVTKKLAITFFNQAYRDGFFHADLHPGNIFVDDNGDIVLVDFGITGVLKDQDRIFIAKVIYAFIEKDYDAVAKLHYDAGIIPKHKDIEYFALACRSVGEPIVGQPVNKISIGKLLKHLLELSETFEMVIQPQFILLQKTILTVEGVGMHIYPEVNMWKLAEPWIKKWAEENFGFKHVVKMAASDVRDFIKNLPHLLVQINEIVDKQNELVKKKAG